jgi:hypothetical protein
MISKRWFDTSLAWSLVEKVCYQALLRKSATRYAVVERVERGKT